MQIGERLRIAREAIGFTLERAARESGIGASSLSEFENDKREPKFSHLSKLAEAYKRPIDFFLTAKLSAEAVMLWRDGPSNLAEMKETEAEFRRLCQQYRRLESCTAEMRRATLPQPSITNPDQFNWPQAELFARKVQNELCLGDVPSASLKKILEERYYVKIFYLEFIGSAISTVSEEFGPAVLLNTRNVSWRRNYDLAHELFHILTWRIFRVQGSEPSELEEKLADAFASRLLMPEESIKDRIQSNSDDQGQISFDRLDNIAREFDVSLEALIYRVASIYRFKKSDVERYVTAAKRHLRFLKPRDSYKPNKLPERYCDLAQRAMREGKLSLMQFAKYMGITYKTAREYLTEDQDFTDEKVSISLA